MKKKPFCSRGHEQTEANRVYPPSCPSGRCRLCHEQSINTWRRQHPEKPRQYSREAMRRLYADARAHRQAQKLEGG